MEKMKHLCKLTLYLFVTYMADFIVLSANVHQWYEIRQLPIPPRIYTGAPAGIVVTRFRLSKTQKHNEGKGEVPFNENFSRDRFPGEYPSYTQTESYEVEKSGWDNSPYSDYSNKKRCYYQFQLYKNKQTDNDFFDVDACSGVLTTSREIQKSVGESYTVIVVAMKDEKYIATKKVLIQVTEFNQHPPHFDRKNYSTEIVDAALIGDVVFKLTANDTDTEHYNKESYYAMMPALNKSLDPWFNHVSKPFTMNTTTGEISLTSDLTAYATSLQYYIIVYDGGSPQRSHTAKLVIHVRNMTAPRNVKFLEISARSLRICWSPPRLGEPDGYVINFNSLRHDPGSKAPRQTRTVNLTVEELQIITNDLNFEIEADSEIEKDFFEKEDRKDKYFLKNDSDDNFNVWRALMRHFSEEYGDNFPKNQIRKDDFGKKLPKRQIGKEDLDENFREGRNLYEHFDSNDKKSEFSSHVNKNDENSPDFLAGKDFVEEYEYYSKKFGGKLDEIKMAFRDSRFLSHSKNFNDVKNNEDNQGKTDFNKNSLNTEKKSLNSEIESGNFDQKPQNQDQENSKILKSPGMKTIKIYNHNELQEVEIPMDLYNFFALQYCHVVEGLIPATNYAFTVRAWRFNTQTHKVVYSMARMPVVAVTMIKSCTKNTCINGVCQETLSAPGFKCICSYGFYGSKCDQTDACSGQGVPLCKNGGTCLRSTNERGFSCACASGYAGSRCDLVSMSKPSNCSMDKSVSDSTCQSDKKFKCSPEKTKLSQGTYQWPRTESGHISVQPCSFGSVVTREARELINIVSTDSSEQIANTDYLIKYGDIEIPKQRINDRQPSDLAMATRSCMWDGNSTVWMQPDVSFCKSVTQGVHDLLGITSGAREMNHYGLQDSAHKIEKLVDFAIADLKVASKVASAISHLFEARESAFRSLDKEKLTSNVSDGILKTINQYMAKVPLDTRKGKNFVKLEEPNLVVEARLVETKNIAEDVSFSVNFADKKLPNFARENEDNTVKDISQKLWVKIPKNSLKFSENDTIRLQFASYKDARFFAREKDGSQYLKRPVLSAAVSGAKMVDLKEKLSYSIPLNKFDLLVESPLCVYWDEKARDWSSQGVYTRISSDHEVTCESTHMTSFSVLIDPFGTPIDGKMDTALSVITYFGLALSSVALVLTVLSYALFKRLGRDNTGLVVMNLSLALLLMNFAFLGVNIIGMNRGACIFFGALLHYTVCASFSWMLIEGSNMYQMLVRVFPSSETHFMRKRVLLGWGLPLVLVLVALIWNKGVYFNVSHSVCVISAIVAPTVYYVTYLGPLCIVLCINLFVFLRVLRVLCQSRPTYKHGLPVSIAQIRGAIAIVALLGISWLFGIFAVGPLRLASQFMFCLTTPFQGLIIFYVRVWQNPDAKIAWKSFIETGSTRFRPTPISSVRTHSTHNSSSANANSGSQNQSLIGSAFRGAAKKLSTISNPSLGLLIANKTKRKPSKDHGNSENHPEHCEDHESPSTKRKSIIEALYQKLNPGEKSKNDRETGDRCSKSSDEIMFDSVPSKLENEPLKDLHHIIDNYKLRSNRTSVVEEDEYGVSEIEGEKRGDILSDKYQSVYQDKKYENGYQDKEYANRENCKQRNSLKVKKNGPSAVYPVRDGFSSSTEHFRDEEEMLLGPGVYDTLGNIKDKSSNMRNGDFNIKNSSSTSNIAETADFSNFKGDVKRSLESLLQTNRFYPAKNVDYNRLNCSTSPQYDDRNHTKNTQSLNGYTKNTRGDSIILQNTDTFNEQDTQREFYVCPQNIESRGYIDSPCYVGSSKSTPTRRKRGNCNEIDRDLVNGILNQPEIQDSTNPDYLKHLRHNSFDESFELSGNKKYTEEN